MTVVFSSFIFIDIVIYFLCPDAVVFYIGTVLHKFKKCIELIQFSKTWSTYISFFNRNYGYNVYIFLPEYVNSKFLNILLDREDFIKHVYYLLLHPVISSHLISLKWLAHQKTAKKERETGNWIDHVIILLNWSHFEIICWQLFVTFSDCHSSWQSAYPRERFLSCF